MANPAMRQKLLAELIDLFTSMADEQTDEAKEGETEEKPGLEVDVLAEKKPTLGALLEKKPKGNF